MIVMTHPRASVRRRALAALLDPEFARGPARPAPASFPYYHPTLAQVRQAEEEIAPTGQETAAEDCTTAAGAREVPCPSGCEAGAPEGSSRAEAVRVVAPANAPEARAHISRDPPAKAGAPAPASRAAVPRTARQERAHGAAVGPTSRAKAGDETAVQALDRAAVEPVSRPAAGRSAAATSEIMDATAGETAPDDDDPVEDHAVEDFAAALERVQARKSVAAGKPAAQVDWQRVSAAHARRSPAPATAAPRPIAPALSPEECKRCGVPGRRGCQHQLPYEDVA